MQKRKPATRRKYQRRPITPKEQDHIRRQLEEFARIMRSERKP